MRTFGVAARGPDVKGTNTSLAACLYCTIVPNLLRLLDKTTDYLIHGQSKI